MAQANIEPLETIWLNGKLVPWKEATVHLIAHVLHYGYGAFEGIRAYETADGRSAIFRLDAHVRRLGDSMKILHVPMPYTAEELTRACSDVIRSNKKKECYLRPMAYVGPRARNDTPSSACPRFGSNTSPAPPGGSVAMPSKTFTS